ncbi:uncharacterized protein LOC8258805 [Ricinus communis]|uniref:Protein binding protein, putative n=1 Tax=Ricinus communis TaxID=3988 RepID=B9RZP6_RICCO|nr:uncharacterized protein LOC8258805 [Ricinus communis]XP_025013146.1 uncharacterized protein LOC8258805 [Ricinus communis]EEF43079.1 protein binding protein, putative [Ricinus communis]|eukprot:XP_002519215.1 uncharacterized protein LOC8258805 [Ricinus communis]
MDDFDAAWFSGFGFAVRKKRSSISRQPCSDPQKFLQSYAFSPQSTQYLGSGYNEEECYVNETALYSDGLRSQNKLKKLKLKLGGVTHTIHTKYASESSQFLNVPQPQEKVVFQDSSYGRNQSFRGKMNGESVYVNETYGHEPVRKSKRVPKRRVIDAGLSEDDDGADEEIRYLGRLNASRVSSNGRRREDGISVEMKNYKLSNLGNEGITKLRSGRSDDDKDYLEDEEPISDDEPGFKSKKLGFVEGRSRAGASPIEFPYGLPPAPPKKQKVKLSEVEQQLKKAEAAQRRRVQSEKAAREAEAEAIRKILGQDSGRKKKEEKMKKQRDELAQGKSANSNILGSSTIRWVTSPTGTMVIFSDDIGLPNIFKSAPCSYPPAREKCAGPNCTNSYKYRDSKSKLPLCSLHCYKAIQGKMQTLVTC